MWSICVYRIQPQRVRNHLVAESNLPKSRQIGYSSQIGMKTKHVWETAHQWYSNVKPWTVVLIPTDIMLWIFILTQNQHAKQRIAPVNISHVEHLDWRRVVTIPEPTSSQPINHCQLLVSRCDPPTKLTNQSSINFTLPAPGGLIAWITNLSATFTCCNHCEARPLQKLCQGSLIKHNIVSELYSLFCVLSNS